MRAANNSAVFYAPTPVPYDVNQLSAYLREEFLKLSIAITALSAGHLDKSYAAPTKPRDGDLRFADGVSWNPGSGQGFYGYYAGAWKFLG